MRGADFNTPPFFITIFIYLEKACLLIIKL